MRITKNFTDDEFRCPCCGKEEMDRDFVGQLQEARDKAGTPFNINSGWRCQKHNGAVGGVEASSHLVGQATDLRAHTSNERFKIIEALIRVGFKRIGIGRTYIHVDNNNTKTQGVMWLT